MTFMPAPHRMYQFKNQTLTKYADDTHTGTTYTFNSLGYRSNREFDTIGNPIVVLGNTLSFGLGLNIEQTFGGFIESKTMTPVYNFSWGRYGHENIELKKKRLQNA
jgi:hypothetical protein